jgi:hypothetical protein
MTFKSVTMWTIQCDACGKEAFEGQEIVAWSDKTGAEMSLIDNADWSIDPSGHLHRCPDHNPFCERCGLDAGELSGERDYMCPTCFEAMSA